MEVRDRADSDMVTLVRIAKWVHALDGYPKYLPDSLEQFVASPDALAAWVAEDGGALVGHVALHRRSSDAVMALASKALKQPVHQLGVIARLLVAPESRRRGIGRMLLDVATDESLKRGLWPILDVVTEHSSTISLYEQAGWNLAGRVTASFSDGNQLEERVFFGPRPSS